MIISFADKETRKLYEFANTKIPQSIQRAAFKKLKVLDNVKKVEELRIPPGNRLEKLSGNRKGQYSIRINDQWRICFKWRSGDAYDVEIVDYH